jgi:streptogramin lyase
LLFMLAAVCAAQVSITEFPVAGFPPSAGLSGITAGSDGAIWFILVDGTVTRSTTSGVVTKFPFPIHDMNCCIFSGITSGPDGNLWFTKNDGIVRVTTSGLITEFPVPLGTSTLDRGITAGRDGNVWFTEPSGKIGRITPSGMINEFSTPSGSNGLASIITGPDGNLWFTEEYSGKIGRITTSGTVTEFPLAPGAYPAAITTGPDGNLWFTENSSVIPDEVNNRRIGRMTPSGVVTEFTVPGPASGYELGAITTGPDGNLWFADRVWSDYYAGQVPSYIGRITTSGSIAEFPVSSALLPTPGAITTGPDGNLWFIELGTGIARLTPSSNPAPMGTAAFLKTDTATGGSWRGAYGADGYNVIGDFASYPAYVTVTPAGNFAYTWSSSTSDLRALAKPFAPGDRIAACWYSGTSFSIDLKFNDSNVHQVALYLLDWDVFGGGRTERVDILDRNGNVLDTRAVSNLVNGEYLVWNLSGHVIVRITNTNPLGNAVVSGLFFGGTNATTSTASFLKVDTTSSGSWKGVYGADGYNVIDDVAAYPAYVAVTPEGNYSYTWAPSTSDTRGLQMASAFTDRIAACWYSGASFSIDLTFNDSNVHQVALYLLDWDVFGGGRTERVDILDGNGNVLDTRAVSNFVNGEYLVWNLRGHMVVRITNTNPLGNAVVSGLFFR